MVRLTPNPLAEGVLRQAVAGGERPFHDGPSQALADRAHAIASSSVAFMDGAWTLSSVSARTEPS